MQDVLHAVNHHGAIEFSHIDDSLDTQEVFTPEHEQRLQPRFEGIASNDRMPKDAAGRLAALVEMKGQKILEEIDDWLSKHELSNEFNGDNAQGPRRMGVGVYFFEYPTKK